MEFSGNFAAYPLGDLLQWVRNDRRTGRIVVRRSTREKRVLCKEGQIVACTSDVSSEFFGRFLTLNGYLKEEELVRALEHCADENIRLGLSLQQLGLMTREEIELTLRDHIRDSICDLFLWERGVFYFEDYEPKDEEIHPAPLDTMSLAIEGARWSDEFGRIRQVFVHDEIVLHRRETEPALDLSPRQERILEEVDGSRTLARMHQRVGGSYFRCMQAALDLCVREILDISEVLEEVGTATTELDISDLIAERKRRQKEQAGTEEESDGSEGPAGHPEGGAPPTETPPAPAFPAPGESILLPRRTLERLVPVWIGHPLPDPKLRAFCRRLDGSAPLYELLGEDGDELIDFVVEALAKGRLALLPRTPEELEALAGSGRGSKRRWWQRG